jgi:acetylornithine/N-succinyldiaminopimelate aminotransferase
MPLGAFIADKGIMDCLTNNPVLGHINTFGGHPVCCAAGFAALQFLLENKIVETVFDKEKLFRANLQSKKIKNIRSAGLMIALEFENFEENKKVIDALIDNGVFTDWFLFVPECLRIVPPLTISNEEILLACEIINFALTKF